MATSKPLMLMLFIAGCSTTGIPAPNTTLPPDGFSLHDLSGHAVDLAAIASSHRATVLVWWGSTCPCVARYHQRVVALRGEFPSSDVAMLSVASNVDDDHAVLQQAQAAGRIPLPLMHDPDGALAKHFGVQTTPTAVLLDSTGTVRYLGWIDNERRPGAPDRIAFLQDALAALLTNRSLPRSSSRVYGCRITQRSFLSAGYSGCSD